MFLLRFQLSRMWLITFNIILQFLERLSTNSAHLELEKRCQEQTRKKAHICLCPCFNQRWIWPEWAYCPVVLGVFEEPGAPFCCLVAQAHGLFFVIYQTFLYITKAWNCGRANPPSDLSPLRNREIGNDLWCVNSTCPLTDVAKVMSKNMPDFLCWSVDRNVAFQVNMADRCGQVSTIRFHHSNATNAWKPEKFEKIHL